MILFCQLAGIPLSHQGIKGGTDLGGDLNGGLVALLRIQLHALDIAHDGIDDALSGHAHCFGMGDVFLNYPEGRITVQEELYPSRYQTDEPLQMPKWNLEDQQDSISGYLCHAAETKFRGKTWKAFYTEEVPASIGPWKLGGLPGMITKVEDEEGIHSFTLCGLLNEEQPLIFTEYLNWFVPQMNSGKMSMARQRIDYQKMTAKKFLKHKKKILGNPRYVQNPTYYAPSAMEAFGYQEHLYTSLSDQQVISVAGVVVLSEGHAYQPLEIE